MSSDLVAGIGFAMVRSIKTKTAAKIKAESCIVVLPDDDDDDDARDVATKIGECG